MENPSLKSGECRCKQVVNRVRFIVIFIVFVEDSSFFLEEDADLLVALLECIKLDSEDYIDCCENVADSMINEAGRRRVFN